jgi:glycosyltransferase involved in cell wall biosynthesis
MDSFALQTSALILTFNEAPNIRRTLEKLSWAREILVVDSFSTDETLAIVQCFPQVRVLQRPFDTFAGQCNFGLQHVQSPWVLSLDSDYVLTDELIQEFQALDANEGISGYQAAFTYCVFGQPLRACLYPPRTVLYRRANASYRDDGHGHRVEIQGPVRKLHGRILHDDRKPLDRWLSEQQRYASREADHLLQTPIAQLNRPDRLRRRIIFAPWLVLVYTLFAKRLILDGWPGWYYALQRTYAELLLSLRLADARLRNKD